MGGYLPQVFERFGSDYPAVMEAFREPILRPLSALCPSRQVWARGNGEDDRPNDYRTRSLHDDPQTTECGTGPGDPSDRRGGEPNGGKQELEH